MKQILNNILSVLLWRPERYSSPGREGRVAAGCALGTLVAGVWWFGLGALFVVAVACLVALVAFPCKILIAEHVPPAALATESVFARALFAASVSTWPVGLAIGAGLPAALIIGIAIHAALEVWLQVLPSQQAAAKTRDALGGAIRRQLGGGGSSRMKAVGPPIGALGGCEIASWLRDEQGVFHDYVGCTSDPLHFQLSPGQTLLGDGLIYQTREAGTDAPA